MSNFWKISGIQHKGWILEYVYDIREDGHSVDEDEYETCMMCNYERIRYVHVVTHQDVGEEFRVGCICAEKMTDDYVKPKKHEQSLRNKSQRCINWLKKEWKTSKNGNFYLKVKKHHILIYKDKKSSKFRCKIRDYFGKKQFDTLELAKIAVFHGIEYFKEKYEW